MAKTRRNIEVATDSPQKQPDSLPEKAAQIVISDTPSETDIVTPILHQEPSRTVSLIPLSRITACILARNEEKRIEDALKSLQGWTDQIIVLDNESTDSTAEIARRYGALVIPAPRAEGENFDALRNLAIEPATGDWIFYLDADERVPPAFGPILKRLISGRGNEFEAVLLPFKHYFCGKWMEHCNWWPGYTRPQLLKKGRFRYNERLHSGVAVDGRSINFPADNPDLALIHYSYDNLYHYLEKLNRYTDGEAENLERDNARSDWQAMLAHFLLDWQIYYDHGQAHRDGMHGFVLSFLSGFYRFVSRAKLWDRRQSRATKAHAETTSADPLPLSVPEAISFLIRVLREGPQQWLTPIPSDSPGGGEGGDSGSHELTDWLKALTTAEPITKSPQGMASRSASPRPERKADGTYRITACVLTRNEETRIEAALQSLVGWTDEIILVDNESTDRTVEIAQPYVDRVVTAPWSDADANFEKLHNMAREHFRGDWIFYLDADERVPPRLGTLLRQLVLDRGEEFEGICVPFKNVFYGKWMQSDTWWPGYKGPQLVKKSCSHYGERIHQGVVVNGRVFNLPGTDPELAIVHLAYDNIGHYLQKINRYTNAEAQNAYERGDSHAWQVQIAHFVHDWVVHYDRLSSRRDGIHGFVQAFLCSFYRFASRAKLWDVRRQRGEASPQESVPATLEEVLFFMLRVSTEELGEHLSARHVASPVPSPQTEAPPSTRLPLLWQGPLFDRSGYAEGGRNLVLALREAGEPIALAADHWASPDAGLTDAEKSLLEDCFVPADTPTDLYVANTLTYLLRPAPNAGFSIARTFFETDRLPHGWAGRLNAFDRLWVPSQHTRHLFLTSGVAAEKIAVIPEAVSPVFLGVAPEERERWPLPGDHTFRFLSIFDWMLHKGWDVLLEGFARAFGDTPDVGLVIKTWSSHGYTWEQMEEQADSFLRARLGKRLADFPNVHLWQADIPANEMPRLYRAADCFVLPTRGEGWCRPLMEAMAMGLPTIATGWSAQTDYHDGEVGYPLRHTVQPVSDSGEREVPFYAGHQWAEPEVRHLQQLLRQIRRFPKAARKKGAMARQRIAERYSRSAVARLLQSELQECRVLLDQKQGTRQNSQPTGRPSQQPQRHPDQRSAVLIQCATGGHLALLELTQPRHSAYAAHHEMDFVCHKGPLQNERASAWDKILLIRHFLMKSEYEYVICLDADTLIVDWGQDLCNALPPDAWLGMARHANEHGTSWFNAGALYIRNTPQARQYFEEVWQAWSVQPDLDDNTALIWVLGCEPGRWSSGIARIDDAWNSTRLLNPTERPIVMGWHRNGTVSERFQMMRGVLEAVERLERGERNNHALWEMLESMGTPEREPATRYQRPLPVASQPPVGSPASNKALPQTAKAVPANATRRRVPLRPRANPVSVDPIADVDFGLALGRPLRLQWEGDQRILSSLAHVNREIGIRLLEAKDVELTLRCHPAHWQSLPPDLERRFGALLAKRDEPLPGPPDVIVRHHFPPNWQRPTTGKLIVMQPWELSHLPRYDWIEGATHHAEEVWVYSRFVRDIYVRSGVPAEKIRVVPLGVRTDVFTPDGPAYPLPPPCAGKTTRFLFVGGALDRKGADLLLESYRRAFRPTDDVCLIVKDVGTRTFYRGTTLKEAFQRAQHDGNSPPIYYLDDDLSEEQLASLYRACTCVVLPYRGEGFGLPPLEGMACGKAVIVTAGGPTDDYVDDTMALRVPYHKRFRPGVYNEPGGCRIDPWDTEPDREALLDALRWVHERPDETVERGRAGRQYVLTGWTWERSVAIAREGLMGIVGPSREPEDAIAATPWPAKSGKMARSAKKLPAERGTPIELSLCLIARDEENNIDKCLESIRPFVDEMIVVDTGSTDRTRELAAEKGARVFDFPWADSFAEARNQSLAQARGGWIFWMDADDVIPPDCGRQLRELIRRHPDRMAAYQVQVRIPPGPGEFGETLVDHVKLFPNRDDLRFEHRIHEQILPSLRRAGMAIHFSDLYVTHAHYDRSPTGQARKRLRDFRLLEMDLRDHPDHPFVLFNLGMTYLYATKEFEVAAHYLRRSLDRSDWRDSIVRKAFALLTTARMCQMDWEAALAANKEGRSFYPDDAELLFQAGQVFQQTRRFEESKRALERLVSGKDDSHYRSVDSGLRTYRGWHELALLYRVMGDTQHCVSVLQRIVEQYPEYTPAQIDLQETVAVQHRDASNTAFANTANVLRSASPGFQ